MAQDEASYCAAWIGQGPVSEEETCNTCTETEILDKSSWGMSASSIGWLLEYATDGFVQSGCCQVFHTLLNVDSGVQDNWLQVRIICLLSISRTIVYTADR